MQLTPSEKNGSPDGVSNHDTPSRLTTVKYPAGGDADATAKRFTVARIAARTQLVLYMPAMGFAKSIQALRRSIVNS
jgi:hypothetical protein